MIKFNAVSKSFSDKSVLNGLSFEITQGEKVCFSGVSGSGKTTVLRIICGFEKADSGSVSVTGRISAVFQENRLFESFSAYENVRLVCENDERTEEALRAVGMWDDKDKIITQLSGGMTRRVAIARALAYDFDILILDEPFTGIDEGRKKEIIDYIVEKSAEKTILLVSHDEDECSAVCQRKINISG